MRIIEIKKLAAVDMAWNGKRIITAEYFFGILFPLGLGLFCLYKNQVVMGIWLITIAINYIPLFLYAMHLTKTNSVDKLGKPELEHAKVRTSANYYHYSFPRGSIGNLSGNKEK